MTRLANGTAQSLQSSLSIRPPLIIYEGEPVIPSDLLAKSYGTTTQRIRTNLGGKKGRFVAGKHFFSASSGEVKALLPDVRNSAVYAKPYLSGPKITLYTRRGAALQAKLLKTPEAWSAYEGLVDNYFEPQGDPATAEPVQADNGAVFFAFNEAQVRVVMKDDSPWFVAKDVCKVLGLSDFRTSLRSLDDDERHTMPVTDSMGRPQESHIVNESGLYSLIMRSRKPEAKSFKKWVTSEVLPAIRRQGRYEACASEPAPEPIEPPKPRLASKDERRPLVELVRSWVAVAPIGYGQAHKQVNAVMGVSSIEDMTPEQVREAMVWVTQRIEEAHACKTEQQQPEGAKALPGSASHAEAIREIGARIDDDIEMFRRTLEKRKHELVEVLGPRIWWGQRRARDLSPEHKARCQTSHTMMLVVEDAFTNILYTARTLRGVVRAQTELEQAAELVHPVEDIR